MRDFAGRPNEDAAAERPSVFLRFESDDLERAWRAHVLDSSRGNLRAGILLGGLTFFLFGALDQYLVGDVLGLAIAVRGTVLALALGVVAFSMTPKGRSRFVGPAGAVGTLAGLGIVLIILRSSTPGSSFYYVGLIPTMMWLFFVSGIRWRVSTAVAVGWIAVYFHVAVAERGRPTSYAAADAFFLLASLLFGACASWMLEAARRRDFLQRLTIDGERRKVDRLLLNVLPESIAERLKRGEEEVVDRFEEASILFVDMVGFTPLASRRRPEHLVAMLGELFTAFDRVAAEEGAVKIKTMGDGYLVVAGLPQPRPDHADVIARTALGIRRALAESPKAQREGLRARMGIACGPAVAGIIGRDRFSYDLWGDTVNLASRLETTCPPGEIQTGPAASERLAPGFVLKSRGEVELRGRDSVRACLLMSERTYAPQR